MVDDCHAVARTMQSLWKYGLTLACFALASLVAGRAAEARPEFFPTLKAGSVTYTNVKVLNKAKSDLFVQHAGGMASIKVKELDKSTQLQLGYTLVDPSPTNAPARVPTLKDIELDPQFEELYEQVVWESREALKQFPPEVTYGALGALFLVYLFYCYCCRLICRKVGQKAVALVWLPLFKIIPLLRAAGMNRGWFLTLLIPPVFVIVFIVWCFKIARARGKSPIVGLFLLLPVLNVLGFLYLALSDTVSAAEAAALLRVAPLPQQPRRYAA
jgi:hypothetical protein